MTSLGTRVFTAVFALALAGCPRPMLWLGEQDAGSSGPDPDAEPLDAGAPPKPEPSPPNPAPVVAVDAGAPPRDPSPPEPPGDTTAPTPPSPIVDAGKTPPDDDDAGDGSVTALESSPKLPMRTTRCPALTGPGMYSFGDPRTRTLSARVLIAPDARSKPEPGGPLILYWHALGSNVDEVIQALGQAAIDDVVSRGGVVVSFESKLCPTCMLDQVQWFVADDPVSDHAVACAIEQARIDLKRIHSVGFSAGGLHTMHLALARSNYLASVVAFSGGATDLTPAENQDATYKVPSLHIFGSAALDIVEVNFNALSRDWDEDYRALGWYTLFCEHTGGHVIPANSGPMAYRFLLDHPYKVKPEPYADMIPNAFPAWCRNSYSPR